MTTHEVIRKRHVRGYSHYEREDDGDQPEWEVYEVGDLIEPTEEELESFGDRFRELPASRAVDSGNPSSEVEEDSEPDEDEVHLSSLNVSEIRDLIESGQYDDHLDEIEAAEEDGEDRVGVKNAIADRREFLEE